MIQVLGSELAGTEPSAYSTGGQGTKYLYRLTLATAIVTKNPHIACRAEVVNAYINAGLS